MKISIDIQSLQENLNRFSILHQNNQFYLHDLYSKDQLYSIIDNDNKIIIQNWKGNNLNPIIHPFSPRSKNISTRDIIHKIILSESSIMKNHSCKIMNISNGQRFLLFKNKNNNMLYHYLDG
jgi:hypothetical protein